MSTTTNPPAANATPIPATTQLTAPTAQTSTPGNAAPASAPISPADARAQFAAELKRYTDKFGKDDGLEYFNGGLTWEASLEKHLEKLLSAKANAEKAAADAANKLEAVNLGEKDGVPTVSSGSKSAKTTFSACMEAARQKARAAAK